MSGERTYRKFTCKDAFFRICTDRFRIATEEIVRQRGILEDYIAGHPDFVESFVPVRPLPHAPDVARRMARAARAVGVGPMAAVAGAMAQLAAEAAIRDGATEAIVDNGGDIYMAGREPVVVGLHAGDAEVGSDLAFSVPPESLPLAVCSSSGAMGRSHSKGQCDLATVVARDAALADAAATEASNLVGSEQDIDTSIRRIGAIRGVRGVLVVKGERVGLAGRLPELVRVDPDLPA